ncbi:putative bifunctional diguanylate cyclase/phosphodiesterase [Pseudomarimonas salicorniae]|uniref:Bifunctional diguanylate cyclase/phosphodiesterase n=1 Tax=Pseudomarimonas salicorniae TaxID=2933270 RepID=A0ABT0GF39_9GAMM|nr:bifunctional diguanylate cyclase/phosphodiesterase [Lysobacter sp. CAU 1642]MCK7593163.1 bifunctional diguanylate cyclase/phosphodiesterase [Lysobacter sp. CAU 1642]
MATRQRKFSLHDKASLLTAGVLIVLVSAGIGAFWQQTEARHEEQVGQDQERIALRLQRMLGLQREQAFLALRAVAGNLQPLASLESGAAAATLEQALLASGLDLEFERVVVFTDRGRMLAEFRASTGETVAEPETQQLADLAAEVIARRSPAARIACAYQCQLIAAEPVLDPEGLPVVIAGSRSLADWVVSFAALDDAELLIWERTSHATPQLVANSGTPSLAATIGPRLGSLPSGSRGWTTIEDLATGRRFAVSAVSAGTGGQAGPTAPLQLALAQDIEDRLRLLRRQQRGALGLGLLALIAAVWGVRRLLGGIGARLQRVSEAMPLIAEGEFEAAARRIRPARRRLLRDESDILEDTASALIQRLTELGGQVEQRDRKLREQIDELRRQGEFVDRLFEHAQLAIIVHDGGQRVVRSNAGGRTLLESLESGSPLSAILLEDRDQEPAEGSIFLPVMGSHDAQPVLTECRLGEGEAQRNLRWIHCGVRGPDDEPLVLSIGLDLTRERRALAEASWMADHDALTGCYNRYRIEREIDDLIAAGKPFAILYIDLDGFGLINKTDGHEAGNDVLSSTAHSLESHVTRRDAVARIGGDEFLVVLRDVRASVVQSVAERIIRVVCSPVTTREGRTHSVSCCIGIALFPSQCRSRLELFNHADAALKEAKRAGQGEWVLHADAQRAAQHSKQMSQWKQRLQHALGSEGLTLSFQPILDLATGLVSHFEALVRMRLPDGSIASPAEFIGVAEETGLIHRVDRWVLNESIRMLREMAERRPDIGVAVNVSGPTLMRNDFVSTLTEIIKHSRLSRPRLIIEITETAALRDIKAAGAAMSELCQLGCEFALDDFGIGYSSFAYLRELPFSYVKLDGSYVRQALKDQRNQAFIRAMVLLANGYQLKTVAEFVESQALQDFLAEAGVHYGQGFHIAKPGPLPDWVLGEGTG